MVIEGDYRSTLRSSEIAARSDEEGERWHSESDTKGVDII